MKKMMWPEIAGSEWVYNGHPVKVHDDGRVEAHPEVLELFEENLSHIVKIVEVDEDGVEVEPEDEEATSEPKPEAEAVESDSEAVSDESGPEPDRRPLEERTDTELRALAKEHDVKLGRTKDFDKIVARLKKAGVLEE